MRQQKQQKNSRSQTRLQKDCSIIGYLLKKPQLLPLSPPYASRSKSFLCQQKFGPSRKLKIPDIYYEEEPQPQKDYRNSFIITEKNSYLEGLGTIDNQQTSSQAIDKKQKGQENQSCKEYHNLCQFHKSQSAKEQNKGLDNPMGESRHKAPKSRYCCETQPSEKNQCEGSRQKLNFSCKPAARQSVHDFSKPPLKLRPIKTNFYQKPQLFGPVPNKLLPPLNRKLIQRSFASKFQEQEVVQKLSKPKCAQLCTKKNCQCFSQSSIISPVNRGFSSFQRQQMSTKKLKIKIDKIQKLKRQSCPEDYEQALSRSLMKKINENKTQRKKKKLQSLHRFDTQPFDNSKFNQNPSSSDHQKQVEQILDENQKTKQPDKNGSEDQSFIKGIAVPQYLKHQQKSQVKKKVGQLKKDASNKGESEKAQIKIQTEDVLIEAISSRLKTASKINIHMHQCNQKQEPNGQKQRSKRMSLVSNTSGKQVQKIGYTFGSKQNSPRRQLRQLNMVENDLQEQKLKEKKTYSLKTQIQYWIMYDIEKKVFMDLMNQTKQKPVHKPKIILVSQVVKENLSIQQPKNQPNEPTDKGLKISQITTVTNIKRVPVTLQISRWNNGQMFQEGSNILVRSRNCISPVSVKSHVNMFNRSPQSTGSSRVKKCFRLPKQSQYVDFVKNYKPINPQISIPLLASKQNFKVVSSGSRFFFGQTISQSIKHGLGVEVTPHQIFQGKYIEGNRSQGFLKQHDGVYQGSFQSNLKHGHGIFRWDNGQVFEGQWKIGTKNGYGVWTSPDGSYYQGEWHLNMQHGKGKHVHPSGVYEGEFKNFSKQGKGKQTFPNGDLFQGQYRDGKPNGHGRYQWKDGSYYEGGWEQGLKQGKGMWHQNSTTFYEGHFYEDYKHGHGIQYYKDGSFMEGQFCYGAIAKGALYDSNKQIVKTIE